MIPPARSRPANRVGPALAAVLGLVTLAAVACSDESTGGGGPRQPTSTATGLEPDLSQADLWLSFEEESIGYDGSTAYPDAAGNGRLGRVVTANGGRLQRAPGAGGSSTSVAFPPVCTAASGCPRAMVEVAADRGLDPGTEDFEYGATVWLAADQTTTGSNLVQKGRFGSGGGQWKLQVDTESGEPSCVVGSGSDALVVRSSVSIADSTWHRVVCRRDAEGISIRVDDTVDRVAGDTGSVRNRWPVRIGSPGVADGDDQFHGRLDDVFVRIDR